MTLKVLTTEDHELYRDGLRLLLLEAIPGVEVIAAGDLPNAEAALARHPDIALLLLDIQLPGVQGLDGLRAIKISHPALPVVVVSTVDNHASIQQMRRLGADGFIAKTLSRAVMVQALKDVMVGLSNKEIANQLNISPITVREYASDLQTLFSCDNRTQTVLQARRLGFILD